MLALILLVLALLFYAIALFNFPPTVEPYRIRLIAAGLFCYTLREVLMLSVR